MPNVGLHNFSGYNGTLAVGVVDFNLAGGAAMEIAIDGVVYAEADAADAPNGVWTNGASAADSATSFAAAVNGDTRSNAPPVDAVVSAEGNSVVLVAQEPGTAGNLAVTSDSATATVEDMHGGEDAGRMSVYVVSQAVTAQDVLANEINIAVPDAVSDFQWAVRSAAGVAKNTIDSVGTVQATPPRFRLVFSGTVDPVATDVVTLVAFA